MIVVSVYYRNDQYVNENNYIVTLPMSQWRFNEGNWRTVKCDFWRSMHSYFQNRSHHGTKVSTARLRLQWWRQCQWLKLSDIKLNVWLSHCSLENNWTCTRFEQWIRTPTSGFSAFMSSAAISSRNRKNHAVPVYVSPAFKYRTGGPFSFCSAFRYCLTSVEMRANPPKHLLLRASSGRQSVRMILLSSKRPCKSLLCNKIKSNADSPLFTVAVFIKLIW